MLEEVPRIDGFVEPIPLILSDELGSERFGDSPVSFRRQSPPIEELTSRVWGEARCEDGPDEPTTSYIAPPREEVVDVRASDGI
jgi:hypothetical protein